MNSVELLASRTRKQQPEATKGIQFFSPAPTVFFSLSGFFFSRALFCFHGPRRTNINNISSQITISGIALFFLLLLLFCSALRMAVTSPQGCFFHPFIFFEVIFPLIALLPEVPSIGLSPQENIDNTQRPIRSWTELPRGSRRAVIIIVRAHGMIMS